MFGLTAPLTRSVGPNERLPGESDQAYRERRRRENASGKGYVNHMTSHRTVAQDKRDAKKRRNQQRARSQ